MRQRQRNRPSPQQASSGPVDLAGIPIDVLVHPIPQHLKERPPTADEVKRRRAPLNLRNDGFRLLR